ncbi:hypothetical protein [Allomesorhizobium camelthorni]|uniref:Uncharacterized protein n=1 Tax=Allomesorhizobium camelthorni TaxID=475069 RepID=A0A6G4W888_9HYPH|nr:hypothetical protein [Mesorhizobium camelthorni]NGO50456.1 hypothetical protein [Mesorhizobium camelthorni]
MSRAVADIVAERQRQIDAEGWTPEHDDKHKKGEILLAAKAYFAHATRRALSPSGGDRAGIPYDWPWDAKWWKPKAPRQDLVRAGALALAEKDRIHRVFAKRADHRDLDAEAYYTLILTEIERLDRAGA